MIGFLVGVIVGGVVTLGFAIADPGVTDAGQLGLVGWAAVCLAVDFALGVVGSLIEKARRS